MLLSLSVKAGELTDLSYLPQGQNYNQSIPLPEEVLGYPVGTWHVRHDQLVAYMYAVAEASDRVSIKEIGRTHEHRPLLLLTISSPENLTNIDEIKKQHLDRIANGVSAPQSAPLIINMGYSVHGNEPSGSNASLLVVYHLAASNSPETNKLLSENVVLIDPSLNPDGLSRFAQWANSHKGKTLVSDKLHREHREHWPSGRTNHYWFDLNRDWLLLTHPESQARIREFHDWRPHILTDFHEMGTDSTYFFQPGISSRKNPWTPDTNVTLTAALGDFHAQALDDNKELYFTHESFDDFYYGKGSTYPDAHGSIGILFEQASSRGHLQDSINGVLSFPDTIQNQVTTSFSTFAGAMANKNAILAYQKQFYNDTQKLMKDDDIEGFVIQGNLDESRFERVMSILKSHEIDFKLIDKNTTIDKLNLAANNALYVPVKQAQYRLIRSLFSERQRFADNTFYDVSNWNLPLAFNFQYASVTRSQARKLSTSASYERNEASTVLIDNAYAYAFEWHDYEAPRLLQHLLTNKVQVRVAGGDFTATVATNSGKVERDFSKGAIVIPAALEQPDNLLDILSTKAKQLNLALYNIDSGLTSKGIDLGSRRFAPVNLPKVLLIGGKGTSQYEVGEIWHYLDTRLGLPATLLDLSDLNGRDISDYTHLIFASGSYSSINEKTAESIKSWLQKGGVLIGQKSALRWFSKQEWIDNEVVDRSDIDDAFSTKGLAYGDKSALAAKKLIAGSVYRANVDLTHPLMFGFERDTLPLFKTSNMIVKQSDNPFNEVATYLKEPLVAGYTADELQTMISQTSAIVVKPIGRGAVIGFVDNIHFRGYWDGTNKLMSNSLYMSPLIN
ncbi:M14 family zinc carboxypeptidase [Glaciecola sp. MH2013]|uniref:M14 family zinc carboxypeptidase n=1 Tax=Glaciecola sp. MH2013 TaxID=2785524 RepID=UPI001E64C8A5|nr:M14 family zinc carboxypeptidase [Glaciecola sp. MH2013]